MKKRVAKNQCFRPSSDSVPNSCGKTPLIKQEHKFFLTPYFFSTFPNSVELGSVAKLLRTGSYPQYLVVATLRKLNIWYGLKTLRQNPKTRPEDCGCKSEKQTTRVVSPKGYVLFYASSGGEYSVTVSNGGNKVVFDSTKLGDGDLFAVSLLEPANYSMTNTMGSAAGEIVVSLTPEMAKQIKTLETRYIDVSEKKFDPERIELTSSQGLVFRIKDTARILIEKKGPSRAERDKPIIRWQKLQTLKK